jgi:hypothetical protein
MKSLRFISRALQRLIPDREIADLGIPEFDVGDLIEETSSARTPRRGLIVNQRTGRFGEGWTYDVLMESQVWSSVSESILSEGWSALD